MAKNISLLGSTGSIGRNVLEVVRQHPGRFNVVGLAAGSNIKLLKRQIEEFAPELVSVGEPDLAGELIQSLPPAWNDRVLSGTKGNERVATIPSARMVVSAIVGAAGLTPTLAAIRAGKDIGLANKETLVMAGRLVMDKARENQAAIIPIDSEHSAIYQCLRGESPSSVSRILLTASGGPFRGNTDLDLSEVSVQEVLKHPIWKMGEKITVDSATMMNKGLEVIEAHFLFDVPPSAIDVVIHPQSVVHSMVEFV
ncbi:MAG: 1-deoxy-D-xylulose-5-phosphate reductoisomerase, partial [Desulfobulbaceae bacterium]|nr:1-deoxy-D-xylulose-5-phosphate reductoisomerase [Desulfobulbaceae bacterium]